ncbi:hypothetical protein C474_01327 [Halogeometricum pallidum JCM 14848]|uniref:Uncharacterized protein n=1 Tax=Halogeometricum pallidum JCM 14848 TaxID=1227487 RepID=M0DHM7_HALPD|nr:hypothetical protein C474_01327 [Halogeometricum pallidum JCM 14848]
MPREGADGRTAPFGRGPRSVVSNRPVRARVTTNGGIIGGERRVFECSADGARRDGRSVLSTEAVCV